MGVADNFRAFRSRYLIPAQKISDVTYRYRRITRQMNRDFWESESEVAHSLYVGSYGRDTAVRGVSDIDVAFRMPVAMRARYDAYSRNGQSALLQAVRASVDRTYRRSYLGADGQVVGLRFGDGVRFEILPVFVHATGVFSFADANGGGSWKTCDPRAEMRAFASRNMETNGNLKALCRMIRVWRDHHGVPIGGMLIDTLAYQFVAGWQFRDRSYRFHDRLILDFFGHLATIPRTQRYWRAPGSGSHVPKTGNFRTPAGAARELAEIAMRYEARSRGTAARNKWREIFGPAYP